MFTPRVAIASLSGESDAAWAIDAEEYVGAAFLGGIAIDESSRTAARTMVEQRDRNEFLPADPFAFIDEQLSALTDHPIRPGLNLRSTTQEPIREAALICDSYDAIVEINAHCRQPELCAVGCGESLLTEVDRLCAFVETASRTGVTVSVKVRAEVPGVDLPDTARQVVWAGADILHVDAMDSEPIIRDLAPIDAFVIANNGVRDRASVREYLEYGADAVSVGRPSDKPRVLSRVESAVSEWFQTESEVTV